MEKIIVINSPLFREKNNLYDEDSLPPIGLALIATALKLQEQEVELLDAVALNISLSDLIEIVREKTPSFVCINAFTTNLELIKEFVEAIDYPTHFIIGGLSTQNIYSKIFNWKNSNPIDIIHGDGELIIVDLILNQLKQNAIDKKDNRRFFKVDKDSIYFSKDISEEKLDRSFFINEPVKHPFGFTEANIVTSRGCIYNCAFCAAAYSLNKEFNLREKSTDSIIKEIDHLKNLYKGLQSIRILDDLFLKNAKSVDKAIDIFKNCNIQWRSMAHVQTFNNVSEEAVIQLKKSGCNELFIGIESGSPQVLKRIHKTPNVEIVKKNMSLLLKNGINIKGYFIYGFPDETERDFEMTFKLAEDLKNTSIQYGSRFRTSVFQFRPYHGTELYHSLEEKEGNDSFAGVSAVEPNTELSKLVGRLQFNFHSGNYSSANIDIVHSFIYKTTNLNSLCIFGFDEKN